MLLVVVVGAAIAVAVQRRKRPSKPIRLWLIRHGQSTFNKGIDEYFNANPKVREASERDPLSFWEAPDHYDPITPDARLTDVGVEQASRLPQILGNIHACVMSTLFNVGVADGLPIELICVSPLSRAVGIYVSACTYTCM